VIIKVKLFAMLRSRLPEGSNGEDVDLELPDGATAQDVIERLAIPPELAHLVMIDGYHVLPRERERRQLRPGEVLAIFPPVAGG
jgi:molybdopterin converting factor small subunit